MKTLIILLGLTASLTSCGDRKQVKVVAPPNADQIAIGLREAARKDIERIRAEASASFAASAARQAEEQRITQEAQDQIEADRRAIKRARRAMESAAPAPTMSQFDSRRLAAAGVSGFAPKEAKPPRKSPVIMNHMGNGNWIGSDGTKIIRAGEGAAIIVPGK